MLGWSFLLNKRLVKLMLQSKGLNVVSHRLDSDYEIQYYRNETLNYNMYRFEYVFGSNYIVRGSSEN